MILLGHCWGLAERDYKINTQKTFVVNGTTGKGNSSNDETGYGLESSLNVLELLPLSDITSEKR